MAAKGIARQLGPPPALTAVSVGFTITAAAKSPSLGSY